MGNKTSEVLVLSRKDIIHCEMHAPLRDIKLQHLRQDQYNQSIKASFVILKDDGQTLLLKSKYDLEDVLNTYVKNKNRKWPKLF